MRRQHIVEQSDVTLLPIEPHRMLFEHLANVFHGAVLDLTAVAVVDVARKVLLTKY